MERPAPSRQIWAHAGPGQEQSWPELPRGAGPPGVMDRRPQDRPRPPSEDRRSLGIEGPGGPPRLTGAAAVFIPPDKPVFAPGRNGALPFGLGYKRGNWRFKSYQGAVILS